MIAADVDHRGELLRLQLTNGAALPRVQRTLEDLGFGAKLLAGDLPEVRWYGPGTVRELSREEAGVVARRVVLPFAHAHQVEADPLIRLVAEALYACFIAHVPDEMVSLGALRRSSAEAVAAGVREELSSDLAAALADAVEVDLTRGAQPAD